MWKNVNWRLKIHETANDFQVKFQRAYMREEQILYFGMWKNTDRLAARAKTTHY